MLSIVFGLIAICLGLFGIISYWYYVVDVLVVVLPVFLVFGGFVALMAGIRNTGLKAKVMESKNDKNKETGVEKTD